jgi:hypothetical protein
LQSRAAESLDKFARTDAGLSKKKSRFSLCEEKQDPHEVSTAAKAGQGSLLSPPAPKYL